MTDQISQILNDPAGMEKIKAMAEGLFGEQLPAPPPLPTSNDAIPDIAAISRMASLLKPSADDSRVRLLYALKPHLSAEKQQRVDKAVKMLKLLELAPLLSQMGVFEL